MGSLALSLTGVGPIGPSLPYMQISLKVLKVRYRQKLGIPQAGSYACFEITIVPILGLISLYLIFL
jgi:hypothetical protein